MNLSDLRVVDLGTKHAGALDAFRSRAPVWFGNDAANIPASACLGIDHLHTARKVVEAKGYRFWPSDIIGMASFDRFPTADYYLAVDFLEHLPNLSRVVEVVHAMLRAARCGIWLGLPSFEHEWRLADAGLRFAWTDWSHHPSHVTKKEIEDILLDPDAPRAQVVWVPAKRITSSSNNDIVPVSAPQDTLKYKASLGPKPKVKYSPPLIGQWNGIITLKG